MLYRQRSEHARQVEEFIRDFSRHHAASKVDAMDVDTREGISTASLYDVMRYPAVLALTNDGQLLKEWQGDSLPLMDEVAYYTH
jgi:hypothetical protein